MENKNPAEIEARVKEILRSFLKPDSPDLAPDDLLKERFDSLSIIEMMFRFEDEFKIEIDNDLLYSLRTYNDLLAAVERLSQERSSD